MHFDLVVTNYLISADVQEITPQNKESDEKIPLK